MKKSVILILVLLFVFSLILINAQDNLGMPQTGAESSGSDVEKIQNLTGNIPIDEEGKLDDTKFQPFKSKAEERIEKINQWLDDNASWLKYVFGMKPEISWLFAINLLIILFLINLFVFTFPEISVFSQNISRIIGAGIVLVIIILGFTVKIATEINELIGKWWFKLAVLFGIIVLITLSTFFGRYFKQKRIKMQEELDRQKLHGGAKIAETFTKSVEE